MARVAIFYPTDPASHVPSGGIDSVIRGILEGAPPDLEYTLFGATSDAAARPVGRAWSLPAAARSARLIPLTQVDVGARRGIVPLTVRYMQALHRSIRTGACAEFDILDFHRIEPLWLFRSDRRPKNVVMHQDMTVIRDKNCDIMWRHAPWLYEWIERRLVADVSHMFCVRRTAVERYRALYRDSPERFSFLPTWVDAATFAPPADAAARARASASLRARLGLTDPSARVIVSVGRLDRQKDPELLLQALHEVALTAPHVHLAMIGDGVLRPAVERARDALGLAARVTLLGVQPPAAIAEVLRGADLFAMSSAYEGMPIALLEALSTGLPVVSTSVGEVPTLVTSGVNGCISQDRTPRALAEALLGALSRADAMMGEPCERAAEPYTPKKVLELIYGVHRAQAAAKRQAEK